MAPSTKKYLLLSTLRMMLSLPKVHIQNSTLVTTEKMLNFELEEEERQREERRGRGHVLKPSYFYTIAFSP